MNPPTEVVCIGAGPAGLTAAYLLSKKGVSVTVLEADPEYVGGLARTVRHAGFHFDIGGHRFFSKSRQVEELWSEILPHDFLERPRLSRIFYRGKFYSYPLRAFEALRNLGLAEAFLCGLSYLRARVFRKRHPKTFSDWVTNQFGRRTFRIFFKSYTEKVWGMSCDEISADWAAQRIKGLSLSSAILNALFRRDEGRRGAQAIKTLIGTFRYPRRGPGMMWEEAARKVAENGGSVRLGARVQGLRYDSAHGVWSVKYAVGGKPFSVDCRHLISSAPIRELIAGLEPQPSPECVAAAMRLRYRDFVTVAVMLIDRGVFQDNWLYIHDPSVRVGRIQNFKAWSAEMVPDPSLCCYGLEYFCFEGDGLWSLSDRELSELAVSELVKLGLARREDVRNSYVVRQPKAYPVYDDQYTANVDTVRHELEARYPGLHLVGRNGMHKYNNQDHAMMTAMLTVENILAGKKVFDVWSVNEDAEYHESLRQVPQRAGRPPGSS